MILSHKKEVVSKMLFMIRIMTVTLIYNHLKKSRSKIETPVAGMLKKFQMLSHNKTYHHLAVLMIDLRKSQ